MRELGIDVKPTKVIRVGQKGRYPRKALAIFTLVEDCERILEKAESVKLANDVFIMRDRTYNQREEARLFRLEREREENAYENRERKRKKKRTSTWQREWISTRKRCNSDQSSQVATRR